MFVHSVTEFFPKKKSIIKIDRPLCIQREKEYLLFNDNDFFVSSAYTQSEEVVNVISQECPMWIQNPR
jgi:hypothetical protein